MVKENQLAGQSDSEGQDPGFDAIFKEYYAATGRDETGEFLGDADGGETIGRTRSGIDLKVASVLLPALVATAVAAVSAPQIAHAKPDDNGTTIEAVFRTGGERMSSREIGGELRPRLAGGGIAELVAFARGGYRWQDKTDGGYDDHPFLAGGLGVNLFLDPKDMASWDIIAGADYAFAHKNDPAATKGFAGTGLNVRIPLGRNGGPAVTLGAGGEYDFAGTNLPEKWHHRLWLKLKAGFRF